MAELVRAGRVRLAHFVRVGKLPYGRHSQGLLGEIVRSGSLYQESFWQPSMRKDYASSMKDDSIVSIRFQADVLLQECFD